MKPAEFYRTFKAGLRPALSAAQFKPAKGGVALWVKPTQGKWLFISCVGNKWGWSEPFGSDFHLTISLGDCAQFNLRPSSGSKQSAGASHVLEFFDVATIARFCSIRNRVIDKGLERARSVQALSGLMGAFVQSAGKELEKLDPPMPMTSTPFPWLDAEDIGEWTAFLQPIVASSEARMHEISQQTSVDRNRYLVSCWKQADPRSDDEKAAHRAAKHSAMEASWNAISAFGRELERK